MRLSREQLKEHIRKLVREQMFRIRKKQQEPCCSSSYEDDYSELDDLYDPTQDEPKAVGPKKTPEQLKAFWDLMMSEDA